MLATYLIRFADVPGAGAAKQEAAVNGAAGVAERAVDLVARMEEVGRLGGGVGKALATWFLETWLYTVLMSVVYGVVCGYGSLLALKFAQRK